ncbi:hypothetical protein Ddye_032751, partial [Dipteronia dyeriana]
ILGVGWMCRNAIQQHGACMLSICFLNHVRMGFGLGNLDGWDGNHTIHLLPT